MFQQSEKQTQALALMHQKRKNSRVQDKEKQTKADGNDEGVAQADIEMKDSTSKVVQNAPTVEAPTGKDRAITSTLEKPMTA